MTRISNAYEKAVRRNNELEKDLEFKQRQIDDLRNYRDEVENTVDALRAQLAACTAQRDQLAAFLELGEYSQHDLYEHYDEWHALLVSIDAERQQGQQEEE